MRLETHESAAETSACSIFGLECKAFFQPERGTLQAAIALGVENPAPVSHSLADLDILETIVAHLRSGQSAP